MRKAHLNGIKMHVQRMPSNRGQSSGTIVVLIHGMIIDSSASLYLTLAPALTAAGADVIVYDLRGHGRTDQPESGYALDAFMSDLNEILDRLGVTVPVHLVGNSYGGTVAFGFAQYKPTRVASVFMIDSEPATRAWAEKMKRQLSEGKETLSNDEVLASIAAEHGERALRVAKSAARLLVGTSFARDIPASRVLSDDQIRAVRCPVLAVYGSESELSAQAPWLEALLPRGRTITIPEHGHFVMISAKEAIRDHLLAWLREQSSIPYRFGIDDDE